MSLTVVQSCLCGGRRLHSQWDRSLDGRATGGAVELSVLVIKGDPKISNLRKYRLILLGIYTGRYRAGSCAQTSKGIRMSRYNGVMVGLDE